MSELKLIAHLHSAISQYITNIFFVFLTFAYERHLRYIYTCRSMIVLQTTVNVQVIFMKLGEIDTIKETFSADVFIKTRWREPRLDGSDTAKKKVSTGDSSCKII